MKIKIKNQQHKVKNKLNHGHNATLCDPKSFNRGHLPPPQAFILSTLLDHKQWGWGVGGESAQLHSGSQSSHPSS